MIRLEFHSGTNQQLAEQDLQDRGVLCDRDGWDLLLSPGADPDAVGAVLDAYNGRLTNA